MRKPKLHFCSIIVFVFIFSCNETEMLPLSEPNSKGFEVLNSRLIIDSPESLTKLLLEAKNDNSYEDFKKNIQSYENSGFKSLMPTFNSDADENIIKEYQAFKLTDSKKIHSRNNLKTNLDEEKSNLNDDVLIADPYFALILNRDREIQVGNNIYKFTDKGLFFTDSSNYDNLIKVAERVQPCMPLSTGPNEIIALDNNVSLYRPTPDPCGGTPPPPPPPYTPPAPPKPLPTKEEIRDNLKVCNYRSTWLDDIFGPSQDCTDNFESDKRIRVKTWSQNYFIFASVGVKVESQNRFMRIWWAEDINEVEVGYSLASFEYDGIDMQWPSSTVDFDYEYGDYVIDQYGQYKGFANNAPRSFFESFPIEDADKTLIKIYLYRTLPEILNLPSNYYNITGKEFNKGVQGIVEDAVKRLKSTLNKEINGNSAVLVYPSADHKKLHFLYTNWRQTETNDNKISETFDWNTAVIGFSTKGGSSDPIYDKPRTYKNFQIVCYGMGRRGSTWKGARISLEDSQ